MTFPSSRIFLILLILSFIVMIILSVLGSSYEKEILAVISLDEAVKLSKTIFLVLGTIFSISSITLFIRHFSRRAIKVAAINRPEYAEKLKQRLNPQFLNNITLFICILVILGAAYTIYEIQIGKF